MLTASPINQCFISMYHIFNILLSPLHLTIYLLNELHLMLFNLYVTKNIYYYARVKTNKAEKCYLEIRGTRRE